jgi:hypothetical protein
VSPKLAEPITVSRLSERLVRSSLAPSELDMGSVQVVDGPRKATGPTLTDAKEASGWAPLESFGMEGDSELSEPGRSLTTMTAS